MSQFDTTLRLPTISSSMDSSRPIWDIELDAFPSFLFVLNPLDFGFALPFEIRPGFCLRKANGQELAEIKRVLAMNAAEHLHREWYYEKDWEPMDDRKMGFRMVNLTEENWRYHVIAYQGKKIREIQNAIMCGMLLTPTMKFGLNCEHRKLGTEYKFTHSNFKEMLYSFLADAPRLASEKIKIIPQSEIELFRRMWTSIEARGPESFVLRALGLYKESAKLPAKSDALALAYFGIIESLLTHKPDPNDTIDSIRRQLRTKIKLLRRTFFRILDYDFYFTESTPNTDKTIWNKLYDYRSAIAHGGAIDFKKEFRILKNTETVTFFLGEAVKVLLIKGLTDEEFLSDLRDC